MGIRIILTDGNGVTGLAGTFGAIIQTNVIQTAADAAAAAASATSASSSATNAAGSATAAATSATNAANSASAAATSATNASNSATAAATSASSASGSATAASNSATNAASSASAASTSATNAAASATAAATSASNAAATLANALVKANNLSDVANAATAATNLGLGTGNTPTFTGLKLSGSTAHGVLIGEAGSGIVSVGPSATTGLPLLNNAGADPSYGVLPIAGGGTNANTVAGALASLGINAISSVNRLINASFLVDQRNVGAAQTITAAAALAYTVDRWWAACTGANVTGQQGTRAYGFTGAASVTGIQFGQRIESRNIADQNGSTVTLSANLANSLLTSVIWTAYYANTADTFGTLASPTKTQIATGTFTVNGVLSRYSAQIALPANAANGVEVVFSVGAQTSGTWTIGDVQLEAGSNATPIERRIYTQELEFCQRYYEIGTQPFLYINPISGITAAYGEVRFETTKRGGPTVTTANWQYYSNGTATSYTPVIGSAYVDKFNHQNSGLTTWNGWNSNGTWTASAEL
jgi:hypothetical protein